MNITVKITNYLNKRNMKNNKENTNTQRNRPLKVL